MRFLLVGAGATGSWIGANLMRAGHQVIFVGRQRFVDAVHADGLFVHLPGSAPWHLLNVQVASSVGEAMDETPFDAVLACMKAYAVDEAIVELSEHAESLRNAAFVTFQNGVGSEEKFTVAFGSERVIAATLTSPVSLEAPATIRLERESGGVGLAPVRPPTPKGGRIPSSSHGDVPSKGEHSFTVIATAFAAAPLLNVQTYDDYRAMKWSKLLLNIMGNATSALLDLPVAEIYNDPKLFAVEMRMLHEALAVMCAHDPRISVVNLPDNPAQSLARAVTLLPNVLLQPILARRVAKGRGDKRPSLYYDVVNRTGKSEVVMLNGAVAEAGRRLGVPTPVNEALANLLMEVIAGGFVAPYDQLKLDIEALVRD